MKRFDWVVGVDPDSERHGVAFYYRGELLNLSMMAAPELIAELRHKESLCVSMENVLWTNAIYNKNRKAKSKVNEKIALSIGRNQQSQSELMRWLEYYSIPFVTHRPQKGDWKNNDTQFKAATGWTKRSNKDTRSAAFFGFLGLNN